MTTDSVSDVSKEEENAALRSNLEQLAGLHDDLSVAAGEKVVSLARESTNILVPFPDKTAEELKETNTFEAIEQYQRIITESYLIGLGSPTPAYPEVKGRGQAIEARRAELKEQRDIVSAKIQKQRKFEQSAVYQRIQSLRSS